MTQEELQAALAEHRAQLRTDLLELLANDWEVIWAIRDALNRIERPTAANGLHPVDDETLEALKRERMHEWDEVMAESRERTLEYFRRKKAQEEQASPNA
jgi:hypothetical protein